MDLALFRPAAAPPPPPPPPPPPRPPPPMLYIQVSRTKPTEK